MISQTVLKNFETAGAKYPHLQTQIDMITNYYREKLWHQMTDELLSYCNEKCFTQSDSGELIQLYDHLIKGLTTRLNPIKYALLSVSCCRQYSNIEDSIKFLEEAKSRLLGHKDAILICKIA
jgi:hypothetical protein